LPALLALVEHGAQRAVSAAPNGLVFKSIDTEFPRFRPGLSELGVFMSCPIPLAAADSGRFRRPCDLTVWGGEIGSRK
jgi:hypothetical protein